MVQLIVGTNRPNSNSSEIADFCFSYIQDAIPTHIISLTDLNDNALVTGSAYNSGFYFPQIKEWQQKFLIPSQNWIIIAPEYNGSFPGVLKLFLDLLSIHQSKETFSNKKVGLIGVSTGRAGNLRGLDHLTSILHYLNVDVMPYKLPVSSVHLGKSESGHFNENIQEALKDFMIRYMDFIR